MESMQLTTTSGITLIEPARPNHCYAAPSFARSVNSADCDVPFCKRSKADNSHNTALLSTRDIEYLSNRSSANHESQPAVSLPTTDLQRALVGGKGGFLHVMRQADIPVPPFTVVDTTLIATLAQHPFPTKCLLPFLPDIGKWSRESCSLEQLRRIVTELPRQQQSEWLKGLSGFIASEACYQHVKNISAAREIRHRYATFRQQSKGACIIRSSGVDEDRFGDAQAGRFDSRVHGRGDILKTCLQVLSSAYRPEVCPNGRVKPIALIMQQCIHCQWGGVVISHSTLQDDTIQVEYAPGQPRGAVSGDSGIRPHRYAIRRNDKNKEPDREFTPGDITTQFVLEKNSVEGTSEETSEAGYIERSITATTDAKDIMLADATLNQLQRYTEQLENIACCPVDIEFGVDDQQQLYLFQFRPVTQLPGSARFSARAPAMALAEGVMVSEGCCSGVARVVSEPVTVEPFPPGAILFADHASDWMLAPDILQQVGGFVFRQGGTNDHVAITLRQAGIPCLLAGSQYVEALTEVSGQPVTLVAGSFADNPGAYLLTGDQSAYWQARSITSGQDTIGSTISNPAEPPDFTRVDEGFGWLNRQNNRLLDYFHADRLFSHCLGPGRSKAISMSANRSDLLRQLGLEVRRLQQDLQRFVSGYQRFLDLATASQPGTRPCEVQSFINELPRLEAKWQCLKDSIDDLCTKVVMPLATDQELPARPASFRQWLRDCQTLQDTLQKLTQPKNVCDIRSAHDLIYWLHQRFVSALAPVAEASGQGQTTEIAEGRMLINILPQGASGLLTDHCISVLTKLNIGIRPNQIALGMLNMVDAACIHAVLGNHVCTIKMLEQAEGGKGRTLRLDISDDFSQEKPHLQGKLKRFWFLVQTLRCASIDGSSRPMAISFNQSAGKLIIEFTQVNSTLALQAGFVKLVTILSGLTCMDVSINKFYLGLCAEKWCFDTLVKKCQNDLNDSTNHWIYKHCLVLDAIIRRCMPPEWHYDYTFFDYLDSEYRLLFEMASKANDWLAKYGGPNANAELRRLFSAATSHLEPDDAARIIKELCVHMAIERVSGYLFTQLLREDFDLDHDRDLVLFLVQKNPMIFMYISEEFKDDIEIAKSALGQNGILLDHASNRLKNDKSLVMLAVNNAGNALGYASSDLKNDYDVVLSATRNIVYAFDCAGPLVKNNEALLRIIIKENPKAMLFATESLKNDKVFVLPLLSRNASIYQYLSEQLKSDPDIQAVAWRKEVGS
ncbi:DUF4116 domain-containing protein [Endozoicomonas sp. SCSIO W0465]|uniref:DUF4116 domain-containing protein n=1 Tax=Endozoicomonas sp. SCSIO W0465 TaxID=2918516 RepID=UPI0020760449|nr:DUF4116 domain-containing protein [Endozoicomonas sp. SCSIO W0465]USE38416.1 DUF4116 domain-containing protein [Endozoicomonas sp. SCSIO W0465]